MFIGNVEIKGYAALAPMAGVADRAFRQMCVDHGAAYTVGEMVSAKGLTFGDRKSKELLVLDDAARPSAVQLFGDDPDTMAQAAKMALEVKPDIIDINFGCPAPKIAGNHCGSALLREPQLCGDIVRAVANAVDVPVTAKIRKGYNKGDDVAVEVALACEAGGAAAVTVHGRTRDQMYAPPVDIDCIRRVKEAVHIPVIGNGDIYTAADAARMYEQTGCDLVMVGRGALGAPWLFTEINALLGEERTLLPPPLSRRMALLFKQTSMAVELKGEKVALLEARKHAAWYMRGLKGAAALRSACGTITTLDELAHLCARVIQENE
ncbi:MAG: tRNA dihydrouridine synthase DusB [Clostridia bacterium]|nr:tRNA dihydrouridine synthase DusB [Clostridia bacterium]